MSDDITVPVDLSMATTEGERREKIQWAFSLFDKNCDGHISAAELEKALQASGQNPTRAEVKGLLAKYDVDGSGQLELSEFESIVLEQARDRPKENRFSEEGELLEAFMMFDTDGSGALSRDELHEVMTTLGDAMSEEEFGAMVKEADASGDGQINYEEFIKVILGLRGARS
eukprot:m51a1_g7316 putative calmodulin (172) ;mRNA; f:136881-137490